MLFNNILSVLRFEVSHGLVSIIFNNNLIIRIYCIDRKLILVNKCQVERIIDYVSNYFGIFLRCCDLEYRILNSDYSYV